LPRALQQYERAVSVQPSLKEGHALLGELYLQQEDYLRAIVAYRELIELAPEEADAYYHLGLALNGRNRTAEALDALETALGLYQQQGNTEGVDKVEAAIDDLD
jgi:tetratricopeptide (TPR) repeat protein